MAGTCSASPATEPGRHLGSPQHMIRALLLRGLLAGLVAGLIAATFAFALGESSVDAAIRIEESSAAVSRTAPSPDLTASAVTSSSVAANLPSVVLADGGNGGGVSISRPVQKAGLFLASALYGLGLGLVFAVVFILAAGRLGPGAPARLSLGLGLGIFVSVFLAAALKYPPNPPAVGNPDTVGQRTWTYVVMLAAGGLALWAGARTARSVKNAEPALRFLVGGLVTAATIALAWIILPATPDTISASFPAGLLWEFRVVSIGTQGVLWISLGAVFAVLSQRAGERAVVGVRRAEAPAPIASDAATA